MTTTMIATYSPDDNKLRLYPSARLSAETYARVKAAGFTWAAKQELFVAPAWTPEREDLLIELCGEIDDEDTSLVDRAEERADRFEGYGERRRSEADSTMAAIDRIADAIPFGQPILVGHHSERRAREDRERIHDGMGRAIKLWETSRYWADRAKGAIGHAKYKELPAVRARRIKGLEADLRKHERARDEAEKLIAAWTKGGLTRERALAIANHFDHTSRRFPLAEYPRELPASQYEGPMGLWSALDGGIIDHEQAREISVPVQRRAIERARRWIGHLEDRLAYERAMLGEQGGIPADRTRPEKGGAVRCWASPGHGKGWSYVKKVNKVSVTVEDNWGNGGANFTRTVAFDKIKAVVSKADVDAARAAGRLHEGFAGLGFFLDEPAEGPTGEARDAASGG
jgi:hypothetical protein